MTSTIKNQNIINKSEDIKIYSYGKNIPKNEIDRINLGKIVYAMIENEKIRKDLIKNNQ